MEQVPITRTTRQLIEQTRARSEALSQVEGLMTQAKGTAHDVDQTMEVTVDAHGRLLHLWLAPTAVNWGADRLGSLIVEVAEVAQREAVQDSYNKVALLLGDDTTAMIEQISGLPAPARAADDDNGLTVEEFQRRRAQRLAAQSPARRPAAAAQNDDDLDAFDPSSLRSDR